MDRLLVILDLDETLVHVPSHRLSRAPDFTALELPIYVRPHLEEFLDTLRERYSVAVWTTANRDYAEAIIARLIPWRSDLAFLWCAEECTRHLDEGSQRNSLVKRLHVLEAKGYDLARVLMVDDSPEKHLNDHANLVVLQAYCGDAADAELPVALEYLHTFADAPDVRVIAKRDWRASATSR